MGDNRFIEVEKKDAVASKKKKTYYLGGYKGNKIQMGGVII